MLSRAFTTKPRRSLKVEFDQSKSGSINEEYDDCIVGFMEDQPLISCGGSGTQMTLREILRASVGVIGESRLGMTEKVVLLKGGVWGLKRFKKVIIGKNEFGRRVHKLGEISIKCEYLVPISAFLYAKRIKFLVSDYYPMGSLADLLSGGREQGQTILDWKQRLYIILNITQAISFIHTQNPPNEKNMQLNIHGNIKSSNIMINVDFTARLSNYGFTQLAEPEEVYNTWSQDQRSTSSTSQSTTLLENLQCQSFSKKCDIYNFGIIILDILGGTRATRSKKCIVERKNDIKDGTIEFFEFYVKGKDRRQALMVLDIALACTNRLPETRPSIDQILVYIEDITSNKY